MRDVHMILDHFILAGKPGLLGPDEMLEPVKKLCNLPGEKSIIVVSLKETMRWSAGSRQTDMDS